VPATGEFRWSYPFEIAGCLRCCVSQVACSIRIACVMEMKATLMGAKAARERERVDGLVEDVRAPLAAIFSIGTMLAPRLKKNGIEKASFAS